MPKTRARIAGALLALVPVAPELAAQGLPTQTWPAGTQVSM